MNALVIYNSIHHGNTEKVARVVADVLEAKLVKPHEVDLKDIEEYDLIGFGSGIYYQKHHRSLFKLIEKLSVVKNKKAFIFSTSGMRENKIIHAFNRPLRRKLLQKGFTIIGDFSCRGLHTYGPFKLVGGINKGRPNEEDLKKAEEFARRIKSG